jgi:diguanylate cyclase (GGDEF)-like protein
MGMPKEKPSRRCHEVIDSSKDGTAFGMAAGRRRTSAGLKSQVGTLDGGSSGNEVLSAMPPMKTSILPMLACAAVAVMPAISAAYFAPGRWTILAAAGAATATTGLLVNSIRGARKLATLEDRERQLQSTASAAETRIAALVTKVREASTHDDVTGTLNRRTFITRLDEVLQRDARLQKPMAFLLVDIDGFRKINADAGRMMGDRVLKTVGQAIQASTRGTDFIGRIGGDEFAVVLGECVDPQPAIGRVFLALDRETTGGAAPVPIRVSIGTVTISEPQRGVDPVQLFRVAEEALASVRGAGGLCGKREYGAPNPRPVVTT